MAIHRTKKTENFTQIDNSIFRDKRLSLKAKGLLSQLLSLPDNWKCSISGLASLSNDRKDSIKTGLEELERYGYIKRKRKRDDKGRFVWDYEIWEKANIP